MLKACDLFPCSAANIKSPPLTTLQDRQKSYRWHPQTQQYIITTTTSSNQALELFKNADLEFDLVITDQTMPEITGDKLVKEILNINPNIPVILCSGYSETIDEEAALELGCAQFLMKPISNTALLNAIKKL